MLSKFGVFVIFLLLPLTVDAMSIDTLLEIDIFGNAKIQHHVTEYYDELTIKIHNPKNLDVSNNLKYSLNGNIITLNEVTPGSKIIYLSNTLTSKNNNWLINYDSLQDQSVKLVLPLSSEITSLTGGNLQSKERLGQTITWNSANKIEVSYKLNEKIPFNYKIPFYFALVFFLIVLYFLIKSPNASEHDKFIERLKGIKRPIIKRVIFAILVVSKDNKLIEQSKIRYVLKKEGFKNINNHRGEISSIVNKELDWLIIRKDSKIEISKNAENNYKIAKNVGKIISTIKKQDIIEKGDGYGK